MFRFHKFLNTSSLIVKIFHLPLLPFKKGSIHISSEISFSFLQISFLFVLLSYPSFLPTILLLAFRSIFLSLQSIYPDPSLSFSNIWKWLCFAVDLFQVHPPKTPEFSLLTLWIKLWFFGLSLCLLAVLLTFLMPMSLL